MFKFRLQTILELRQMELEAAEQHYALKKAKRENAEQDLEGINLMIRKNRTANRMDFQERLDAHSYTERLEDEARAMGSAIAVLQTEEDQAMDAWIEARKEVKAIQKLKEKALEEFNLVENRKEQAAIDEWATLRRAS